MRFAANVMVSGALYRDRVKHHPTGKMPLVSSDWRGVDWAQGIYSEVGITGGILSRSPGNDVIRTQTACSVNYPVLQIVVLVRMVL